MPASRKPNAREYVQAQLAKQPRDEKRAPPRNKPKTGQLRKEGAALPYAPSTEETFPDQPGTKSYRKKVPPPSKRRTGPAKPMKLPRRRSGGTIAVGVRG